MIAGDEDIALVIRMVNYPLNSLPYLQPIIISSIAFWQPLPMHRLQNTVPIGAQMQIITVLYDSFTIIWY